MKYEKVFAAKKRRRRLESCSKRIKKSFNLFLPPGNDARSEFFIFSKIGGKQLFFVFEAKKASCLEP